MLPLDGSNEKLTSPQNDVSISFESKLLTQYSKTKKSHQNRKFGRVEPYPKIIELFLPTYQEYQSSLVPFKFCENQR